MDKSINPSFIKKNFGAEATSVYRKEIHPFNSVRRPLPDVDVFYVIHGKVETVLCSCECHVNDPDLCVMH